MKIFFPILFLLIIGSCITRNVLYTDHILVKKTSGQQDTILNTYWGHFEMDEYKMEWLLKKNNINPKDIIDIKLLYTTKQRFTHQQLNE